MSSKQNALTFDVEDYFQVTAFENVVARSSWHLFQSRVENNTRRIMEILDVSGIKATFFVLGWIAERYPQIVSRIAKHGHEIACHGYSHKLIYTQKVSEFRRETKRAKDVLEDILGSPIRGYRAASYSVTKRSLWALDVLAELGFEYDSSIYPIRHDTYGIPSAPRYPHLINRTGATILEFPIAKATLSGIDVPVGGGGYFRLLPYFVTAYALQKINTVENRPFIFYLHPWEFDPNQPRIAVNLKSRIRHYQNLKNCEKKFKKLIAEFRFSTVREVLTESRAIENEVNYGT